MFLICRELIQHGFLRQDAHDLAQNPEAVGSVLALCHPALQSQRELLHHRSVHLFAPDGVEAAAGEFVRHLVAGGDAEEVRLLDVGDGGEFVFEMGGKGCAEAVHSALECLFARRNRKYRRLQYFPSIGEYSSSLEKAGFKVDYAILFDRPTAQKGDDGLASWIRMFNLPAFDGIKEEEKEEILKEAESLLRPKLFRDNRWIIDYVRLRCRAVK